MLRDRDFEDLADAGIKKVFANQLHYKYINMHDGVEYVLGSNTLKFTDPIEFNDPFDCNEQMLDIVIDPVIEKQLIIEAGAKYQLSRSVVRKHFKMIGKNAHYKNALRKQKKQFKVSCFSEIDDDVLMWSHYADKHKGICIGFGLNLICPDYVLYPVNYLDEVQQIDGMANTPYVFYFLVTFKAHRWSYEREVRAVSKTGDELIAYPRDSVKEIIFGCNVKPSEVSATIKTLKKLRYKNLSLFQMTINERTMLLKKESIRY